MDCFVAVRGLLVVIAALAAGSSWAVTISTVPVANAGNANDWTGLGSVGYDYLIGAYEVRNAEYVEFLNAKAASDPLGLYNPSMGSSSNGGIARSGASGGYSYAIKAGMGNRPVNFVSFYDAIRFANWLNNGQGVGDTETGAYTILGGAPEPTNGADIVRNVEASWFLPSENEWYKAAFHKNNGATSDYFAYPTSNDAAPKAELPPGGANSANTHVGFIGHLTDAGAYTATRSPYQTYDQSGNVGEWIETPFELGDDTLRIHRGGGWTGTGPAEGSGTRNISFPMEEDAARGFRVAAMAAAPGPAGDFDADGDVDGSDFLQWQRGESTHGLTSSDLDSWESDFGAVPLAAASTPVPESMSGGTLLLTAILGLRRRAAGDRVRKCRAPRVIRQRKPEPATRRPSAPCRSCY
ncbi:MAG: SUMF1/EgtB/PvdO family nonheme iron enzyme [Pirellulales bacterium]|nr:SUMF1/EgtB/PvdO family nonheme iron enzyme [Pirellulales bacterium]